MALAPGQPKLRFAQHFNPGDISGLSYAPKIISVHKSLNGSAAENVIAMPAGAFLTRVIAVCEEQTASTNGTCTLGLDGDTDLFINSTNFSMETTGNKYVYNTGYFFAAADNLALEVAGSTVTDGQAQFVIEYFELTEMFEVGGVHISL